MNGTISDTRAGNLLAAGNPNVVSSTCAATLATGASCTIVTRYTVLDSDSSPLVNTVTVNYNPQGFPNEIRATASDSVVVNRRAEISISKEADALSKIGDSVTYTFEICNDGASTVTRGSVTDTLLGDLTAFFPASLAPGQCVEVVRTRTVAAGDPDPLVNTVTATYTAGTSSDTATATDSTNLFQPSVDVTKNCAPDPVDIGGIVTCTIVVTNTSSADSPGFINGTISRHAVGQPARRGQPGGGFHHLHGDARDRRVLHDRHPVHGARDRRQPARNTVTVNYNPMGFPNNITDTATDCVDGEAEAAVRGALPASGSRSTTSTPGSASRRTRRSSRCSTSPTSSAWTT